MKMYINTVHIEYPIKSLMLKSTRKFPLISHVVVHANGELVFEATGFMAEVRGFRIARSLMEREK